MTASREPELLASEQMRDRIADFLEGEAAQRGGYHNSKARLLFAMSCVVRRLPGQLAQPISATDLEASKP